MPEQPEPTPRETLEARARAILSSEPRPFLRWAGSKQRLLRQLVPYIPSYEGCYHEPFFGSGAMYFLLQPKQATLSDACVPLIQTYSTIRDHPLEVQRALEGMDVLDRDQYYRVRATIPPSEVERAARFIYLNRAGWNGLYRVNNRGQFNVPYGMPKSPNIIDESNLLACAELLTRASIGVADFESVEDTAKAGDFVYFDPPYVTGHNNNGFIDYNERLFSWADQQRLASLARRLQGKSVHVLVSNANHEALLRLYPTFRVAEVSRFSSLAGATAARKYVTEAVFFN